MNIQNLRDAALSGVTDENRTAREWLQILAKYRDPDPTRSTFELLVTLIPFCAIWAAGIWVVQYSYIAALVLASINGLFLVRLFCIQHDCGHASFYANRKVSDWVGRCLGVLTLTPYHVWRRQHAIHHSASGNLDMRGIGDVTTLTVDEYLARSTFGRFMYRMYRSPVTLFLIGPAYIFLVQNRVPFGLMKSGASFWISAMGTNVALLAGVATLVYLGGWAPLLLVILPTWIVAASAGVWLFYVQHQFEDTHWRKGDEWQLHEAALEGSSHYVLPKPLQWLSANIGIHHVHHLYSRIPFYRLTEVIKDHPILAESQRMTISESISCARLHLWDESQKKLLSFRRAHALYLAAA
jgi:acyl-lipid omega-6 desaturase (Delta-12 desaturase)